MKESQSIYPSLDTPAILLDLDRLEANVREMAQLVRGAGFKLVPHSKCHKSPEICRMQLAEGAVGITVSKLSEAEVLVKEGIRTIEIVHPIYGDQKLRRFGELFRNPQVHYSLVVDMLEQAQELSKIGQAAGRRVPILLKINTGLNRFGVPPGAPALETARKLVRLPGVELIGILAHESCIREHTAKGVQGLTLEATGMLDRTALLLKQEGIPVRTVAAGATPSAKIICRHRKCFPEVTELHPGAYALGDWMYINAFAMSEEQCAATILTTVLSTTCPGRASIDAGAKTVGVDSLPQLAWKPDYLFEGRPSYGSIRGRPDIRLESLHEEIGILRLTDPARTVALGDRLEILANHVSLAVALHDVMYGVRGGKVEKEFPIALRGKDY